MAGGIHRVSGYNNMNKNKEAEDCYRLLLRQYDQVMEFKRQYDMMVFQLKKELKAQLDKTYSKDEIPKRYQLLYDNLQKEKKEIAEFDRMVRDGF